jgi:cbb3-type cytochrome oxidase subunit 3
MDLKLLHEILRSAWTAVAVVTFVAIALWAFWPGNRAEFDRRARIPLDER